MKSSTCVVLSEREFPVEIHTPGLLREAMCVGRCTILSEELYRKRDYHELEDGVHSLVTNILDGEQLKRNLKRVIENPDEADEIGKNARKLAEKYEDFNAYIESTIALYEEVIQ